MCSKWAIWVIKYENIPWISFKGSSDQNHFIFLNNIGKSRIWHKTIMNLNDVIFNRFRVDFEILQSCCTSDPTLSDIDFKNKMAWSELPLNYMRLLEKQALWWFCIYTSRYTATVAIKRAIDFRWKALQYLH